jgi:hypothetical protein
MMPPVLKFVQKTEALSSYFRSAHQKEKVLMNDENAT